MLVAMIDNRHYCYAVDILLTVNFTEIDWVLFDRKNFRHKSINF